MSGFVKAIDSMEAACEELDRKLRPRVDVTKGEDNYIHDCCCMAEWLTRRTGNLMIAKSMGSNPSGASRCFLEQKKLNLLLRTCTGWLLSVRN
jgi:hypothetical protein